MAKEARSNEKITIDFNVKSLPAATGVRMTLRFFLMEHTRLFDKVSYCVSPEDERMTLVITLREALTAKERKRVEDDVRASIEIVGKLAELHNLR